MMGTQAEQIESDRAGAARRKADSRHLILASAIVSGLTTLTKMVGVVREAASAAVFGANRALDSFLIARNLSDMVSQWIEAPVRGALIPLFTRKLKEEGEAAAWSAASNLINCLLVLLVVLVGVLLITSGLLVRGLSTGFRDEKTWGEAADLAQIISLSIVFAVLGVIFAALSNVYRRQAIPGLARMVNGLAVLGGVVLLGPRLGLTGYAYGILIGSVVAFFVQADVLWRHREHYRFIIKPRAPEIREIFLKALPLFIGLTGTRIDVIFDRNFASYLPEGSISILGYALFVSTTVTEIVVTVSQSVFLPHFAELSAEKRFDELGVRLSQTIMNYCFVMAPLTALVCGAARPLVDLAFLRGKFTMENAALTAIVVPILAAGDPFFGIGQIFSQVFISGGDTKTPMVIGFQRIGYKILVSITLLPFIGIFGLAFASASSNVLRSFLLWRRLPKEVRPHDRLFRREIAKMVFSTILVGAVVAAISFFFPLESRRFVLKAAYVCGLALFTGVAHCGLMILLKSQTASILWERLATLIKGRLAAK